tara:strand:+ start:171 stop:656 length:486 start_codon:yes stop_codon:yes gene_type:complete
MVSKAINLRARRKEPDMTTTKKSPRPTKQTVKAVVKTRKPETLVVGKEELSYDQIWLWVNSKAGGNLANVKIVPLDNVDLTSAEPVPFGYGGKTGGVRQQIQDWMLKGVDGDMSLKTVLGKAAKLGHSRKKPVCLHALMHGGYSPSSSFWMTPYVRLEVQS